MLIKRLAGAQQASATDSPADNLAQPAQYPLPSGKGPMPTEIMPGTGTAPLPRNTVLQGRYDVEQVLGVGGMSTVYKARDLRFTAVARYCAIKEMLDTAPGPAHRPASPRQLRARGLPARHPLSPRHTQDLRLLLRAGPRLPGAGVYRWARPGNATCRPGASP